MNPVRRERLPWRELDGRVVVIHPESSKVHELNEVASSVWRNLNESAGIPELVSRIICEYDVPAVELEKDLSALLAELDQKGLIRWKTES